MASVIVTGGRGQLGQSLADTRPDGLSAHFFDSQQFNLCDFDQMRGMLDEYKPEIILNCAAYTNVDGAQSNEAQAEAVNHTAVADLAELCLQFNARLMHVSTDFVFDGLASVPYTTDHPTAPLGVYGRTKYAGEQSVLELMPETAMIIRTSWLYSEYGANFVKTMLRLFDTKDSFSVVCDQFGSPTYARGLAQLMWHIVDSNRFIPGVLHWSDAGVTSWFDFAREIGEQGARMGLLTKKAELLEILAKDYGSVTPRPGYSALDCNKTLEQYPLIEQLAWEVRLQEMLTRLKES